MARGQAGQGGWDTALAVPDDLDAEVARAFDDVGTILREAGATCGGGDVVAVDLSHVSVTAAAIDEAHTRPMVARMQARMPGHRPIWTQDGVHTLGAPRTRVEIRVTAPVALVVPAARQGALTHERPAPHRGEPGDVVPMSSAWLISSVLKVRVGPPRPRGRERPAPVREPAVRARRVNASRRHDVGTNPPSS